jgi:hypothetical protein
VLPRLLDEIERFEARPREAEMQALLEREAMEPLFT